MNRNKVYLLLIILLGSILRFYNLSWGEGNFFHPDENNMARAVSQMGCQKESIAISDFQLPIFKCSIHPHFFAYGQLPLYLAFFSSITLQIFGQGLTGLWPTDLSVSFEQAVLWLRFYSAAASTLTIPLTYLISKKFLNSRFSLLASILVALTPGLIQAAHFGTTESLLAFFFTLIVYLSLRLVNSKSEILLFPLSKLRNLNRFRTSPVFRRGRDFGFRILVLGIVSGLALGAKLTSAYFLAAPVLAIVISYFTAHRQIKLLIPHFSLFITSTLIFAVLSSPYNLLDFQSFIGALKYETSVATGAIKVFYTRQFEGTTTILFQLIKIFPYSLGHLLELTGIIGFLVMSITLIKRLLITGYKIPVSNQNYPLPITHYSLLITVLAFLAYLLPNAGLYAKWTRFMTPVLPFFAIFTGYLFSLSSPYFKKITIHKNLILFVLILFMLLPGILFFTIYARPDTRVKASRWIYENIPADSYILSEGGNVVDLPVKSTSDVDLKKSLTLSEADKDIQNYQTTNFDFYNLDSRPNLKDELLNHLVQADYIIIPSRRIFANHLRFPRKYPVSSAYYRALFSGRLGFILVHKESPFVKLPITNYSLPVTSEHSEETFSVFDHPTVRIYKKTTQYNKERYKKIL